MTVTETSLKGLFLIDLDVYGDERGNFREAWQAEKMMAAGLPEFHPVQSNVSESALGTIRGIHAEPWEKYIHIAFGTVFAAMIDLREDSISFGKHLTFELDKNKALYVSRGFGNSFQVTSEHAAYTYLVTSHWQAGLIYPAIAYDDSDLHIAWPITGPAQIVSEKDKKNPTLRQFYPHKF